MNQEGVCQLESVVGVVEILGCWVKWVLGGRLSVPGNNDWGLAMRGLSQVAREQLARVASRVVGLERVKASRGPKVLQVD